MLNNLNSRKEQSEALLGLAMHTIQDYYSHLGGVEKCIFYKKGKGKGEKLFSGNSQAMTAVNYLITPHQNMEIEDNTRFLNWRYSSAEALSNLICKYYSNGKTIKAVNYNYLYTNSNTFYVTWYYKYLNGKKLKMGTWKSSNPKQGDFTKYIMSYYYFVLSINI